MTEIAEQEYLMEVIDIKKYFTVSTGKIISGIRLKAVDGVSFNILRGETFGLVGESGCGKSTLAMVILRLIEATIGSVCFQGLDIYQMKKKELRSIRKDMQIVFQDPFDSLNPRMTLEEIMSEPFIIHRVSKEEKNKKIKQLFKGVGLSEKLLRNYPHQLSGGQRQRVCIARSLALSPKLIICDEAVSALDVSIQAQILNLLIDVKEEFNLTYIFITHNLAVAKFISDRIGVMYFGKLVEVAAADELFNNCLHPYTHALLSALPSPDPTIEKERVLLEGSVPSLLNPPKGCVFHERCSYCQDICKKEIPRLIDSGDNHMVACHFASELNLTCPIA